MRSSSENVIARQANATYGARMTDVAASVVDLSVIIDSARDAPFHRATLDALAHAADGLSIEVSVSVVRTPDLRMQGDGVDVSQLGAGVLIGPGAPYDEPNAANAAIRTARERGVPLVGT